MTETQKEGGKCGYLRKNGDEIKEGEEIEREEEMQLEFTEQKINHERIGERNAEREVRLRLLGSEA